jgi:hypothetical protein
VVFNHSGPIGGPGMEVEINEIKLDKSKHVPCMTT